MANRRGTLAPGDGGAHWCDEHQRNECTRQSKNTPESTAGYPRQVRGGRCHQPAIRGTDACRVHAGIPAEEAKAQGQAALLRTRFRDVTPDQYVDPWSVLSWAVTVAFIDIADYRAQLAARVADGKTVEDSELDRMMRMQAEAVRMSKMAVDAGVNERAIRLAEETADKLVTVIRGVLSELGHDEGDPTVQAVVRRQLELVAPPVPA